MTGDDGDHARDKHDGHQNPDHHGHGAHWVYSVFFSLLFTLLDFAFLWPEHHFLALLSAASALSVVAVYEAWKIGRPAWGRAVAIFLFVGIGVVDMSNRFQS
jgi:hypothetical protein